MDAKDIRVDCPCCRSRLDIDVRTSTVVRWRKMEMSESGSESAGTDGGWGSASERVNRRLGSAEGKFDDSLSREKGRTQDLDEVFRRANEELRRRSDE